jgi:hypothetical protein
MGNFMSGANLFSDKTTGRTLSGSETATNTVSAGDINDLRNAVYDIRAMVLQFVPTNSASIVQLRSDLNVLSATVIASSASFNTRVASNFNSITSISSSVISLSATVSASSASFNARVASNTVAIASFSSTVATGTSGSGTAQYYVSTTGSDANSGSIAAPWLTIQHALNVAVAGDTINVRSGTYHERLSAVATGTALKQITLQNYGFGAPTGTDLYPGQASGEAVVLDFAYLGTVTDGVPFLNVSGKSYIAVQGLTFQNLTCSGPMQQGVRVDGSSSFVQIKHCRFLNNKNTYTLLDGTNALLHARVWGPAHDITFYGCEFGNINTVSSECLTFGSSAYNCTATRCWLHDLDGIGIDVWNGAHDCTISQNHAEYISVKRSDGTRWYGVAAVAIYVDGGNTVLVDANRVEYAGVGFEALSEPTMPNCHHVTFRNNVASHCHDAGILIGTWYSDTDGSTVANITVVNNTFVDGIWTGVHIRPMVAASVSWRNNIIANNATNYYNELSWPTGDTDYNLYFGNGGTGPGMRVNLDPKFTNTGSLDYSLVVNSPAIDVGDPGLSTGTVGAFDQVGHARFNGRIDIGAYEYVYGQPSGSVSVVAYGAVGNGSTDDTPAFRAAAATGKTLWIPQPPSGSFYKLTGRIDLSQSVYGDGRPLIKMTNPPGARNGASLSSGTIFEFDGCSNLVIQSVHLNGGWAEIGSPTTYEWSHGIQMRQCSNMLVDRCIIENCYGDGILVGGEGWNMSTGITIQNSMFYTCMRCCVSNVGSDGWTVNNCYLEKTNTYQGTIDCEPSLVTDYVRNVLITNNVFNVPNDVAIINWEVPSGGATNGPVNASGNRGIAANQFSRGGAGVWTGGTVAAFTGNSTAYTPVW